MNLVKQGRPWCASFNAEINAVERANLDFDENGWVRSFAVDPNAPTADGVSTLLFTSTPNGPNGAQPGRYILDDEGEGRITYSGALE